MRDHKAVWIALLLAMAASSCTPAPTPTATPTVSVGTSPSPAPALTATHTAARPLETTTTAPSATAVPTPIPAPTVVAPLTWEQLKNGTYVLSRDQGGPPEGLLPMEDGSFTYAYVPGAASVENYFLYRGVAFGDVNADGAQDAVVVLVHSPAGSGTFYHLAVALNEDGAPRALPPAFLGDRVVLERIVVEDGEVLAAIKTYRDDEPFGSTPTLSVLLRYRVADQSLELVSSETVGADEVINDTDTAEPVELVLPANGGMVSYGGRARPFGLDRYLLRAGQGQRLALSVNSPNADAFLSVFGLEDGSLLVRANEEQPRWTGVVGVGQRYAINVFAIGLETEYTLNVSVSGAAVVPTPEPEVTASTVAPTAAPETPRVVYLTFDDGPTPPYTWDVLEVLERYGARVTFFVLGQNATRYRALLEAADAAGHALGNHTYDHRSLVGMSAEDFAAELKDTAEVLGELAAPCLRPPFGATDARTRARAAELGYSLVMWNVDTLDWRQPGENEIVQTVLGQAYSGAIVLMHDGGGDRDQTVAALERVLEALSAEGYTFAPVCEG